MRDLKSALPWIIAGLVVVLEALLLAFMPLEGSEDASVALILMAAAIPLVSALTALIIAVRSPGNRVAWVLFGMAVGMLAVLANPWEELAPEPDDPSYIDFLTVSFSRVAIWVSLFLPLFTLAYLFPTGRFLTRRARWIGRYVVTVIVVILAMVAFSEEAWVGYVQVSDAEWIIENPIPILGFVPSSVFDTAVSLLLNVGGLLVAIGGIVSMFRRYRRSDLTQRTQIKWLLYALTIAVLGPFLVMFLIAEDGDSNLIGLGLLGGAFLVPIAITVAIVQYRLFDIDRIISRTVAYVLVVTMLGLIFAAGVVWLPSALGVAAESPLLVAATTLLVAALFNPLRKRLQEAVDRRFNRSRYQARLVEERFTMELQDAHSSEELTGVWLETVDHALSPQTSGVWLRSNDRP